MSDARIPEAPPRLLRLASPIGRIELRGDDSALTGLSIERDGTLPNDGRRKAPSVVLERAAEQLAEYFAGTRSAFGVPVSSAGTAFQQRVWAELAAIPLGSTRSYGEIAARVGVPHAARAVGRAIGANPVPVIIPCHRVVGQSGAITGYSAGDGVPTKRRLLAHEGVLEMAT